MVFTLLSVILSYLVGAIPSAYIVVRLFKGIDIRNYGSGNVGFTNALRVIGVGPSILVLVADIGKGILSVLVISRLGMLRANPISNYSPVLCGLFAIIGHIWTVFLKFRGGKGVATSLGVFFALHWLGGVIGLAVWIAAVAITRYVSIGSMLLCISFCITAFLTGNSYTLDQINAWSVRALGLIVTFIVIYKHRSNISRLIKGEERKIGQKEHITPSP